MINKAGRIQKKYEIDLKNKTHEFFSTSPDSPVHAGASAAKPTPVVRANPMFHHLEGLDLDDDDVVISSLNSRVRESTFGKSMFPPLFISWFWMKNSTAYIYVLPFFSFMEIKCTINRIFVQDPAQRNMYTELAGHGLENNFEPKRGQISPSGEQQYHPTAEKLRLKKNRNRRSGSYGSSNVTPRDSPSWERKVNSFLN